MSGWVFTVCYTGIDFLFSLTACLQQAKNLSYG